MTANLSRAPLTKAVLDILAADISKVGDGQAPGGAGWIGEPNAPTSRYVPYLVVAPMAAQNSSGPLGDSQADWRLPYRLTAVGVQRGQAEWLADKARSLLDVLRRQVLELGASSYKVQQVRTELIGATTRVDSTDPPYWTQTDSVTVWLTKEFS